MLLRLAAENSPIYQAVKLKQMRNENQEGHSRTTTSLTRLEASVEDLKGQMTKLERQAFETEERICTTEETGGRHGSRFLMWCEIDLTERCEDFENRLRH